MTRTLHLIKHGQPQIQPGVPAHEWTLAPGALDALPALAARLTPRPGVVVSSEEPKARATGEWLAAHLHVPFRAMLGLHEQLRYTAPFHADVRDFQADLHRFFAHPDEVVSGEESARDARARFTNAVTAVMRANPHDTVAVVAHGTVISLLVAHHNPQVDVTQFWTDLPLLGAVTLDWPGLILRP
jgi:broad specificity phosphatase PhoE